MASAVHDELLEDGQPLLRFACCFCRQCLLLIPSLRWTVTCSLVQAEPGSHLHRPAAGSPGMVPGGCCGGDAHGEGCRGAGGLAAHASG